MRIAPVVFALLATTTLAAQNVSISVFPPPSIAPDTLVNWTFVIRNVSGDDLPPVPITIYIDPAVSFGTVPAQYQCNPQPGVVHCTLPAMPEHSDVVITIPARHPFQYGRVRASATVVYAPNAPESGDGGAVFWKDFPVTSTADAGPGSLRQTILDVNAHPDCQERFPEWHIPCRVAFQITEPVPAEGWYTIRPSAPLPALRGFDTAIDGSTQTGNNQFGPQVALDGSQLTFGNGIVADAQVYSEVRGLAIGGFPWNGISITARPHALVRGNYIGVDPTGRRAHPNGSRGISSAVMSGTIQNNVIGGNVRSGIFFLGTERTGPHIRNNRIGVGAHDDTPIGNGASGIFIADFFGYYANPTIEGNVIANNAHFGIALGRNADMIVLANTIRDNGAAGIDIGLDGPTESVPGVPGVEGGVVPPPVILSATYENGVTTIKGFAANVRNNRRQVLLYANSKLEPGGFAEGEQFLGITPLQFNEDTAFTFVYPGDLRGKYINGTTFAVTPWGLDEYSYTSSEFGRALAVEE